MRLFQLFVALVYALPVHLHAQTIQKSVKSYPDGSPDTIWHVKNRDTFLIEAFRRNGRLEKQFWHQDSMYTFDDLGQIQSKIHLAADFKYPKWIHLFYEWHNRYYNVPQKTYFYPNGKLESKANWSRDKVLTYQRWQPNGLLIQQSQAQQRDLTLFEQVTTTAKGRTVVQIDTLKKFQTIYEYHPNNVLKRKKQSTYTVDIQANEPITLIELSIWDSLGKLQANWAASPQHLKSFKDNGLCLYGFVNEKQDTILPAQFQNIKKITNNDNTTYYLVNDAQHYGILNEKGHFILSLTWDYLEPFYKYFEYETETEMMEKLLLRCRTKTGFGVIKMNGEIVLNPVYQDVRHCKKDSFEVKINGHYGIVDKTGKIIVAPLYPKIYFTPYPDVFEIAETVEDLYNQKTKYSVIHKTGKILLPSLFRDLSASNLPDSCYLASVFEADRRAKHSKAGVFHLNKGWIMDTLYRWQNDSGQDDIISNETETLHGLVATKAAKIVLPCAYRSLKKVINYKFNSQANSVQEFYLQDTYYIGEKDNQYGLFDLKNAVWKLPLQFNSAALR
jgi:hypothetical protein